MRNIYQRVAKLERVLANEFLGFEKPKKSEEVAFVNKLFQKFPLIKSACKMPTGLDPNGTGRFQLTLFTKDELFKKYHGLGFNITSSGSKNNMYVTAFDKYDSKIETLKPVNIDRDLDKIGKFITNHLMRVYKPEACRAKNENVSISSFDCRFIENTIDRELDKYGAVIDVNDDNAINGFVNVGIEINDLQLDYDVIVEDSDNMTVECDGETLGNFTSLQQCCKRIIAHVKENM